MVERDKFFMRAALEEALKTGDEEVPVGAVFVLGEEILSRAHNETIGLCDPTAHAEIIALRRASLAVKNYRLPQCEVYVTLEPCTMCLGALIQARIRRLVFGALDPKAGAVFSILEFPFQKINHRIEVCKGVMEEECSKILKDFFKKRRKN